MENTLTHIFQYIQTILTRAAADKKHPCRLAVIATTDNQGNPNARTLVLRKYNTLLHHLIFYTDIRSPKIIELTNNSTVVWLFYHPKQQIQLKITTQATIDHQSPKTKEIWNTLPYFSRLTYLSTQPPSAETAEATDGLPLDIRNNQTLAANYDDRHFAIVTCEIIQMEYLKLDRSGNKRARFVKKEVDWESTWLIP